MQAAVSAERAQATARGQPGQGQPGQSQERPEPPRSALASPPADNGPAAPAARQVSQIGQVSQAVRPEPASQPDPAAEPERKARPAEPERKARPAEPKRKARPVHPVTPEPAARPRAAAGAPAIGNPVAGPPPRPRPGAGQASARRSLLATSAIAVALVVLAAACLGVAVARYLATPAVHTDTVSPAIERAEAASRRLAATWVTREVSHAVVVACDPLMCAALTADGFPSRNVSVLGQTATYPLTSAVVVVTQPVRDLFGSSFTSNYAPAVLAAFGSADASITVRVIASHGAQAYQTQLAADLSERKKAGSGLVHIPGITASAEAQKQLEAGLPDARLLVAIAALDSAVQLDIDILDFGNIGPGEDPTVPLRFADLAENDQAAHMTPPAYLKALRASLGTVPAQFRPTIVRVPLRGGRYVLRIECTAPTPLNVFTSG